jgi:uncharacterized protein
VGRVVQIGLVGNEPTTRPLALVTGASSGIGAEFARRLGTSGYDLVVVGRRRERLEDLAGDLPGASVEIVDADLGTDAGLSSVVKLAEERPLAMLVNNAGLAHYMPFTDLPADKTEELVRVNVLAPTMLARAAVTGMVGRGFGQLINLASLLAFSGTAEVPWLPRRAVYAGTRAFIVVFTERLAAELKDTGVHVQVLCPGVVRTEFHTRQGMDLSAQPRMEPGDVVTASLSAVARNELYCVPGLSEPAALDTIGEAMRAMLGQGLQPTLADRYRPASRG